MPWRLKPLPVWMWAISALLFCQIGVLALETPSENAANTLVHASGTEARILWFDANANFERLATPDGVRRIVEKCKLANINIIVVDVKDISGDVLYDSRIAPRVTSMRDAEHGPDFDLLRTATQEARKQGIAVYASINVFSEGKKSTGGPALDHPGWESTVYAPETWVRAGDSEYPTANINSRPLPGRLAVWEDGAKAGVRQEGEVYIAFSPDETSETVQGTQAPAGRMLLSASGAAGEWLKSIASACPIALFAKPRFIPARQAAEQHNAIFVNPANPDARAYELSIIREIAENYKVDGIILDRMRYPGLNADFSDFSKDLFETWAKVRVEHWPEDVITFGPIPSAEPVWGPLFKKWVEWRAHTIKTFLEEARSVIKGVTPEMEAAIYVGSWYWDYYPLGVNWASDKYQPQTEWASPDYKKTGYAPLADWITTGCYYPIPTRAEATATGKSPGGTVEAAAQGTVKVIDNATFNYAGLYVLDYKGQPEKFREAIDVCRAQTQGVMIFDLVYLENYGWWDILNKAFPEPAAIPHKDVSLRQKLRELYDKTP